MKLDVDQVEKLARIGCTDKEIALLAGISESTLRRRCREALSRGRASLAKSLRRKQLELARKGSVPMLIWLGKQYLGQTDRQEVVERGGESRIVERIVPADGGARSDAAAA